MVNRFIKFFTIDIWRNPIDKAKPLRGLFLHWTRISVSAWNGFNRHQSYLKASLLTYYTLLSIVPVLAVTFGIAKGFGFENYFEKQLIKRFQEQEDIVKKAVEFAHKLLTHTQEGLIVAIGVITLFWTVLRLVGNIESSLNEIWGVKKSRTFTRKITDYFTLIIFCPFFFVFSSSAGLYVITQIGHMTESTVLQPIIPAMTFSLHLGVSLVLSWLFFSFIYTVMPNAKVRLKYGIMAGLVGGTIYQVVQWIYITFQVGVSNYGAIYGSFAALPLFLIWVHLSWIIFLLGAEIGYCAEDESYVTFHKRSENGRGEATRIEVGALIATYCVQAFCSEESPIKLRDLSNRLQISYRLIREIVDELVGSKILSEISQNSEIALQPAKDVSKITLNSVILAMNPSFKNTVYTLEDINLQKVQKAMKTYDLSQIGLKENILLKTLLE